MTQAPRTIGDVVVPLAVTFRMAAWESRPPRGFDAGKFTLRGVDPLTFGSS